MRNVISYRKDGVMRFYGVYRIDLTTESAMDTEVRCPRCGKGITEDDIQTGWKQYSLDIHNGYDQVTILAVCPECGKRFAYIADIRPSK